MAVQALYTKWRPMSFPEVVGQQHVTYTLQNALRGNRVGHAYLLSGPRGTGKTSMARLLAKAVNCLSEDVSNKPCNECLHCKAVNEGRFLDLIEIDAASHTGVDDVRELRDRIAFAPNEGQYKVYIIDEVHRFSGAAFDALLKTIEEPPAHAIFILATTEIHKVPQTIKSRCQRFDFHRLSLVEIVEQLARILEHEGVHAEDLALELVARQATGSMRDAISLLDQLLAEPEQVLTLELAQAVLGIADEQSVHDLTDAILNGDAGTGLEVINHAINNGADARQLANQIIQHLRRIMLVQTGGANMVETEIMPAALEVVITQSQHFARRGLLEAIKQFKEAAADRGTGWQPQLPLELALVGSIDALHAAPPQAYAPPVPHQAQQSTGLAPQHELPSSAAAAPSPEQEVRSTEPAVISSAEVNSRWREVLSATRQIDSTGMIQALLRSGRLVGVEGDFVVLQMTGDVLCAKIEDDANREVIETALQYVFNIPLKVRCRVQNSAEPQAKASKQHDPLANDSVVSFAVNELGGVVSNVEEEEESDISE